MRKNMVAQISSSSSEEEDFDVKYKSKRSALSSAPADQGATATLEIETPVDRDAQAIFEKSLQINKVKFHSPPNLKLSCMSIILRFLAIGVCVIQFRFVLFITP